MKLGFNPLNQREDDSSNNAMNAAHFDSYSLTVSQSMGGDSQQRPLSDLIRDYKKAHYITKAADDDTQATDTRASLVTSAREAMREAQRKAMFLPTTAQRLPPTSELVSGVHRSKQVDNYAVDNVVEDVTEAVHATIEEEMQLVADTATAGAGDGRGGGGSGSNGGVGRASTGILPTSDRACLHQQQSSAAFSSRPTSANRALLQRGNDNDRRFRHCWCSRHFVIFLFCAAVLCCLVYLTLA